MISLKISDIYVPCMIIPRENDYIRIKGEPLDTYHLVVEVCLDAKYALCLEADTTPLDRRYVSVPFANIDEIKPLCHNW